MFFLFILISIWSLNAQTSGLPQTPGELRAAFLRVNLNASKEAEYKKQIQKNIDQYISGLGAKNETQYDSVEMANNNQLALQGLSSCMRSQLNVGFGISDVSKLVESCSSYIDLINKDDLEILKSKGVVLPEDFFKSLKEEASKFRSQLKSYEKDQLIVVSNYLVLDEVTPQLMTNLEAVAPGVKELSTQVGEIMVKFHASASVEAGMRSIFSKDFEGKEDLFEFWQALSLIRSPDEECSKDPRLKELKGISHPLKNLNASFKGAPIDADQFLLGVTEEVDPHDIRSYQFSDKGKTYYLFEKRESSTDDENWVMGTLDEQGKLTFRYFSLKKDQSSEGAILKSRRQEIVKPRGGHKFFFESQEGLMVRQNKVTAPVLGSGYVPQGKVIIGQVHMGYLSHKSLTQSSFNINQDGVSLTADTRPINNDWSFGGGVSYSPFSNKVEASSRMRIENFMLGYGSDSDGNSAGSVSYILDRNFMTMTSNLKSNPQITMGRQFKKGKGFVSASTNLNKYSEIKLIIFPENFAKH